MENESLKSDISIRQKKTLVQNFIFTEHEVQSKQNSIVFMQPEGYSKLWVINIIP